MIVFENLSKTYGQEQVLDIPDLRVPTGERFGLVGNNGAGKTTMFSLLLDLIRATTGTVSINGINVSKSEEWKSFTRAFISESFLLEYLTADEFFSFVGNLYDWNEQELNDFLNDFNDFFNNEIRSNNKYIRDLSKGNQKKIGIVAALIGNPEIVILDEPFANLDPGSQLMVRKILKNMDTNVTLLVSSHNLSHITEVCNRIVVLNNGKMVKDIQTSNNTLSDLQEFFVHPC